MSNNNVADISTFESLQTGQHAKIGVGSISIFNTKEDVETIKKAQKEYSKALDKAIEAKKEYRQVLDTVNKDRKKQSDTLNISKNEQLKKDFKQESDEIRDLNTDIFTKESQVKG
ncbi:MAG: hypothetical protein LBU34_10170 [Planctomycetaceae bacterium]|jgi:hypothetical protein|nr:hypothetical protein [Planctomycetaceae bacterium]